MEISERLQLIASMVDKCDTLVDVGTDHGYIPIYLIKKDICNKAIASDINKGPVEKAKLNIEKEGLNSKIECRKGSGLSTVRTGEADVAVIAGMGGNLIIDIIKAEIETFKKLSYAILQPVQNPEVLRKYIYDIGYTIIDEELCYEDNKFYEIFKIRYDNKPAVIESIFYEISKILIEKKHPLIKNFIEFKIRRYSSIYEIINEDSEQAVKRKNEVFKKISKLKELKSCL